jgi:hypothetical protein
MYDGLEGLPDLSISKQNNPKYRVKVILPSSISIGKI